MKKKGGRSLPFLCYIGASYPPASCPLPGGGAVGGGGAIGGADGATLVTGAAIVV